MFTVSNIKKRRQNTCISDVRACNSSSMLLLTDNTCSQNLFVQQSYIVLRLSLHCAIFHYCLHVNISRENCIPTIVTYYSIITHKHMFICYGTLLLHNCNQMRFEASSSSGEQHTKIGVNVTGVTLYGILLHSNYYLQHYHHFVVRERHVLTLFCRVL